MRISEVFSQRMYLRNLKRNQADLDEALLRMSTGQKLRFGSDDPSGAAEVIRLRDESSKLTMRRNGISQARPWLQLTEQAVTDLGDTLSRAWSYAIQGANGPLDDENREALGEQISGLRKTIEGLANLRVAGRYIFSGTLTDTPPYDAAGNYQGNSSGIDIPVDTTEVRLNLPGDDVFGDATAGGPLKLLSDLETALRTGTVQDVQDLIDPLRDAVRTNAATLAKVGNYRKALEDADIRMTDRFDAVLTRASDVAAADLARAISDATRFSQNHEATLAAGARLYGPTFFDYLG